MPLTYTDFILLHPVWASDNLDRQGEITRMLARHTRLFPLDAWEDNQTLANDALMLFVCHLLTLEAMRASAEKSDTTKGAIKRVEIDGKVGTEYFKSDSSIDLSADPWDLLAVTKCGRELEALDSTVFRYSSFVVGPGGCTI